MTATPTPRGQLLGWPAHLSALFRVPIPQDTAEPERLTAAQCRRRPPVRRRRAR